MQLPDSGQMILLSCIDFVLLLFIFFFNVEFFKVPVYAAGFIFLTSIPMVHIIASVIGYFLFPL